MSNDQTILPLEIPMCRTYPHTAHALAILQNDKKIYPWLLNSFIQVEGWDGENLDFEDFWILECPLLRYQRVGKDLLERFGIVVDQFIKESIDFGYYVYLVLNTELLSVYGNVSYPHDAMIYGYDNLKEVFYVADFFNGKRYGTAEISFSDLSKALKLSRVAENHWIFRHDLILLKINEEYSGDFSSERVKSSLAAYLRGEKTKNWYHRSQACYVKHQYNLCYGMHTYTILYNHIDSAENGFLLEHWRQVFHFFYEHKKTMEKRIIYMTKNTFLTNGKLYCDAYSEMKKKAYVVREQFLKFSKNEFCDLELAEGNVKYIEKKELELIPYLINDIIIDNGNSTCGLIF